MTSMGHTTVLMPGTGVKVPYRQRFDVEIALDDAVDVLAPPQPFY